MNAIQNFFLSEYTEIMLILFPISMYANANGELFYQMNSQGVVTFDKRVEFASQITSIGKSSGLIV